MKPKSMKLKYNNGNFKLKENETYTLRGTFYPSISFEFISISFKFPWCNIPFLLYIH